MSLLSSLQTRALSSRVGYYISDFEANCYFFLFLSIFQVLNFKRIPDIPFSYVSCTVFQAQLRRIFIVSYSLHARIPSI